MKIKLLVKLCAAFAVLLIASCAPGTGLTVNLFPAVPTGGGGYYGGPPQGCPPQGRPMPRVMPGQACGPNGRPVDPRMMQNGGNPWMPMHGTNNYPGQVSMHPSGFARTYPPGSRLPSNVSPDPNSRYFAGDRVQNINGGRFDGEAFDREGGMNYTSGGQSVNVIPRNQNQYRR